MAQLTIYLDDPTLHRIEKAARREKRSVSQWVRTRLSESFHRKWPEEFVASLGSLRDTDLQRPPQGSFDDDTPREKL